MTDSLIIKDGSGNAKYLTVESGSYGLIPVHAISSSAESGSYVTASAAYPVYVTGNVSISQPVNVDVVVGDNIAVTSSLTAPLYVSSSANSPILVTGSLTVNTASLLTVTASSINPVSVTGTVSLNTSIFIVTSSANNPLLVTGSITVNTASLITVTASQINPVYVTGSIITNPSTPLVASITSVSSSVINWSIPTSGTAIAASMDYNRKGLVIFNPGPNNAYLAICSTITVTNGFTLSNTSSAPDAYSFVLYPSGTYVADSTTATMAHGVYYISGAANDKLFVTTTY